LENPHNRIVNILIEQGYKKLKQPYEKINFTKYVEEEQPYEKINFTEDEKEANDLLNNLKEFPHAFVLGCIMDRRIKSGKAWIIPYKISQEIGDFSISKLLQNKNKIKKIFENKNLHRYNSVMAKNFYRAIQQISKVYHDDASRIWEDTPRSGMVVRRFLRFEGVGFKIASMATNILARDFKISMKDLNCIDVSPDIQVKKAFKRLELVPKNSKIEELMYCARELNPEYPGVLDYGCWKIGKNCNKPEDSKCKQCYLHCRLFA